MSDVTFTEYNRMWDEVFDLRNQLFKRDIEIIRLKFELEIGRSMKESFADLQRHLLSQA